MPSKDIPKGLAKTLKRFWPAIDEHLADVLDRIGEPNPLGVSPLEFVSPKTGPLGCGVWGCVYPLASTDRLVLKVSADPTEGAIADAITAVPELRSHQGVVWMADIARLPENHRWRGKSYTVWLILREAIKPFRYGSETKAWPGFSPALLAARQLGHEFGLKRARVDQFGPSGGRLQRMEKTAHDWEAAVYDLEATPPGEAIGGFIQEFYRTYGGILSDVHLGNVGWPVFDLTDLDPELGLPTKMLKVFDPGHSWLPVDFEERLLRAILGNAEPNPRVKVVGG